MLVQTASDSLLGNREENQDRLSIIRRGDAVLAAVIDGMGGHESGAQAAQAAIDSLHQSFNAATLPFGDLQAVLASLLTEAHNAVVKLGEKRTREAKPRATCVVAIIQDNQACWAHIGDSRVYWLRGDQIKDRTRDHSHVEILLQEGLITEDEFREHPLRNYVEYCLGGEPGEPTMTISRCHTLEPDDIVLLCSDGLWGGAEDREIAHVFSRESSLDALQETLTRLLRHAANTCSPSADNTTAAAVRWQGQQAN